MDKIKLLFVAGLIACGCFSIASAGDLPLSSTQTVVITGSTTVFTPDVVLDGTGLMIKSSKWYFKLIVTNTPYVPGTFFKIEAVMSKGIFKTSLGIPSKPVPVQFAAKGVLQRVTVTICDRTGKPMGSKTKVFNFDPSVIAY